MTIRDELQAALDVEMSMVVVPRRVVEAVVLALDESYRETKVYDVTPPELRRIYTPENVN